MGVLALLSSIARGSLRWNDWFGVASRVFLGCGDLLNTQNPGGLPTTVRLAVQYGGIATIAPWLDMSADLRAVKLFSMQMVKGRMGLLRRDRFSAADGDMQQLQSVEGDFAVLKAEHTQEVAPQMDELLRTAQSAPECTVPRDDTAVLCDMDMVLVRADDDDDGGYMLWLRVSTDAYSRLIDPSSAIRALPRLLATRRACSHPVDKTAAAGHEPLRGVDRARTFNDVLGLWGPGSTISESETSTSGRMVFRHSPLCESRSWFNITVALAVGYPWGLGGPRACLACRMEEMASLREMAVAGRHTGLLGSSRGFVISVSDELMEESLGESPGHQGMTRLGRGRRAIEWRQAGLDR